MTVRILLEPIFVLHHRPYRNSSLILEFLSSQYGRVAAVARSARGPKSRYRGYLQLFSPLLASWSGRHELMNLNQVELRGMCYQLTGQLLMCGFYLNELLLRLLPRDDPAPEIFTDYEATLRGLEQSANAAVILRRFEKRLLDHLGYGLSFSQDVQATAIHAEGFYQWLPDRGFQLCAASSHSERHFLGRSLLALQAEQWDNSHDLQAAKRLMRLILNRYLGGKPLKSRELL